MIRNITGTLLIACLAASCTPSAKEDQGDSVVFEGEGEFIEYNNLAAEGFNQEDSDMLAMLLADKCMQAMGGRAAWDATRYFSWNFFGRRDHLWDKETGDIRIEAPAQSLTILMNIYSKEGTVYQDDQAVTDSLDYFLEKGYSWWINDAYWLFMPYKMKDTGVTLKYLREDTTLSGALADVLQLSFQNTGLTPQNRYEVWIDADSKYLTQWRYFQDTTVAEPNFTLEWTDYRQYGEIMLSSGRGEYTLENIQVFKTLRAAALSDPAVKIASL